MSVTFPCYVAKSADELVWVYKMTDTDTGEVQLVETSASPDDELWCLEALRFKIPEAWRGLPQSAPRFRVIKNKVVSE